MTVMKTHALAITKGNPTSSEREREFKSSSKLVIFKFLLSVASSSLEQVPGGAGVCWNAVHRGSQWVLPLLQHELLHSIPFIFSLNILFMRA